MVKLHLVPAPAGRQAASRGSASQTRAESGVQVRRSTQMRRALMLGAPPPGVVSHLLLHPISCTGNLATVQLQRAPAAILSAAPCLTSMMLNRLHDVVFRLGSAASPCDSHRLDLTLATFVLQPHRRARAGCGRHAPPVGHRPAGACWQVFISHIFKVNVLLHHTNFVMR